MLAIDKIFVPLNCVAHFMVRDVAEFVQVLRIREWV